MHQFEPRLNYMAPHSK